LTIKDVAHRAVADRRFLNKAVVALVGAAGHEVCRLEINLPVVIEIQGEGLMGSKVLVRGCIDNLGLNRLRQGQHSHSRSSCGECIGAELVMEGIG
jgi:hypothetical protein